MKQSSAALALAAVSAPPSPASQPGLARADALFHAGAALLAYLEAGRAIDAAILRRVMVDAFGASDAEGAWGWKDAYEAGEVAQVLFLRKFGPAMRARPLAAQIAMLAKVARLLPTHTRRSEEAQALQQFSTPMPLGLAAATAAAIAPGDVVLEPSAGTGLLAVFAELAGTALVLNELGDTRADLLSRLFPDTAVTRFDAARIHDHLDVAVRPSVVLMNPPFSVGAHVDGRVADAAYRHIASALARLTDDGRLVAITGASFSPDNPAWDHAFRRLEERGRIVFTAALDGSAYARHGTTVETRLTVIDRVPSDPKTSRPASRGIAPDVATLLGWIEQDVPRRPDMPDRRLSASPGLRIGGSTLHRAARSQPRSLAPVATDAVELTYLPVAAEPTAAGRISESLYEPFALQSVRIPDARPHPTPLVQSAAMASVRPPVPTYRPHLTPGLAGKRRRRSACASAARACPTGPARSTRSRASRNRARRGRRPSRRRAARPTSSDASGPVNDLGVIDRFLDTFARYIDSGFGLLQPEVAYLSSTLVVIDVTLAALFWAMGGEEVMPRLVKKILYVGAFAFIIGNFNWLASIVFRSFAGLGLKASGASIGEAQLLQPGRLATVGVQAAQPMLDEIGKLAGFPSVFTNIDTIVVLFVAWIIVIVAFFILAVQLFVSVLEFKLTTLAGFVLVPFALWNRTSFLAEKVLGNVVASGIKVLVLAVIVGIGTGLFSEFQSAAGAEPTISDALAIVLASVSLLGLGIFGPGIANGLVSGAPQLGAGSAVGTAAAGAGLIAAGGMGALAAGRATGGAALGATRAATSLAGDARAAYAEGAAASGSTGMARAGAGVANVARSGASDAGDVVRSGARRVFSGNPTGKDGGPDGSDPGAGADGQPPAWASRLRRGDTVRRGVETAAHTIRSADHGGAGPTPNLKDPS